MAKDSEDANAKSDEQGEGHDEADQTTNDDGSEGEGERR
jgi:hypothetical protein